MIKEITFYYGPKNDFLKFLPSEPSITISELAVRSDKKMREHVFRVQSRRPDSQDEDAQKPIIETLVGFSDQYAALSESAIYGFLSFIDQYDVHSLFLQNPPTQIFTQFQNTHAKSNIIKYAYNSVDIEALREISGSYDKCIFGQEKVLQKLLVSLYPLSRGEFDKPIVMLLCGPSGVGKSETAKFLSKIMRQKLFRRQFSMFNSGEFISYVFGARHSQGSLARDFMERESNIILFDEFDKCAPVFHSAFYQLFDEGIYEDKNYRAELQKSVIVCTSNYASEDEAKEKLGAALFSRFDAVIPFGPLSESAVEKIIHAAYESCLASFGEIIPCPSSKEICAGQNGRNVQRAVRDKFSSAIIEKEIGRG